MQNATWEKDPSKIAAVIEISNKLINGEHMHRDFCYSFATVLMEQPNRERFASFYLQRHFYIRTYLYKNNMHRYICYSFATVLMEHQNGERFASFYLQRHF